MGEIKYRDGEELTKLEHIGLQLLADGVNALHYHFRKRLRRKIGRRYQLVVDFKWESNGVMDIDTFTLRELRR